MAVWDIKERNNLVRSNEVIDVAPVCLWGGGATPSTINVIEQVNPVSTGNTSDFGDLLAARQYMGGMGNKIKGIYGGGDGASNVIQSTAMFATGGNCSDFGNLTVARLGLTAVGNDTRILFAGGDDAPSYKNEIDQVNFATTGNATDFGDLQTAETFVAGCSSTTRGVVLGGNAGGDAPAATGAEATTHLITLDTLGNATDFGEMVTANNQNTAASNNVKGVVTNGQATLGNGSYEQFNIATTGSFSNFGQLTAGRFFERGAGSQIAQRGLFGGGANPSNTNIIDFCSLISGTSFTDFGDLAAAKKSAEGLSNNAGGIGGSYLDLAQRPSVTYMPGSGRVLTNGGNSPYGGTIEVLNITVKGSSSDFGDSAGGATRAYCGAASNMTRAMFMGGDTPAKTNLVDAVEFASLGNSMDFGNLTGAKGTSQGLASTTRAVNAGGVDPSAYFNVIEYVAIATAGNFADFGDLSATTGGPAGLSSPTRGLYIGGYTPNADNKIDYITIASTGDATDFGNSSTATVYAAGAASETRGLRLAGVNGTNVIDYMTIANTGNATDFGDLTVARHSLGGGSNNVLAAAIGGSDVINTIDFVTIATTGNAADFGDLTVARGYHSSASDNHGGLQH